MRNGWTGKRLRIDLSLQKAWTEEIPPQDMDSGVGGRTLNGKFLLEQAPSCTSPSSPESFICLAVGPLAGTSRFCSEPAGVMEQEATFLTALQSAATFRIDGSKLEIQNGTGQIAIVASRAP